MTHFEQIQKMSVDELSEFLADQTKFPHSPCYICEYDEGMFCRYPFKCTREREVMLYKEWLSRSEKDRI